MLTQAFAEALAEAEKLIAAAPFVASEQDLAEGYDYLAGSIQASLRLAWAYQRDFPYFVPSTGPYTKMGLDNPDTLYFHAYLRDDAEYVVTGRRGSTADLSFQVLKGDYSPVEVPDSLSAFDDRAIEVDADGAFELRFGPSAGGRNSFRLGAGSSMLLVREVYSDWAAERRGTITIRRLDRLRQPARAQALEGDGSAMVVGQDRRDGPVPGEALERNHVGWTDHGPRNRIDQQVRRVVAGRLLGCAAAALEDRQELECPGRVAGLFGRARPSSSQGRVLRGLVQRCRGLGHGLRGPRASGDDAPPWSRPRPSLQDHTGTVVGLRPVGPKGRQWRRRSGQRSLPERATSRPRER